jgi:geranylgeranyl diphosphate synthase type I
VTVVDPGWTPVTTVEQFVARAEHERDLHMAGTIRSLSVYGYGALLGADGINHARQGSKQIVSRLMGLSYLLHGGPDAAEALSIRRMALAATSHEMYIDASLIHDDLMDRSATRRGRPSLHKYFARVHQDSNWAGDSARMARCLALMIGDVLLVASENVFSEALDGLRGEQTDYMRRIHQLTRIEQMMGQSLDTLGPYIADADDPDKIIRIANDTIRAKTARYLAGAPLALGAAGAGAAVAEAELMMEAGILLGEAYQLQDDIVGALGDPEVSGKPVGQDLIDGKRTVLVGLTLRLLGPAERRSFAGALARGDAPPVDARVRYLQGVIRSSGAVAELEAMISDRRQRAFEVMERSRLDADGQAQLRQMADWFLAPARN